MNICYLLLVLVIMYIRDSHCLQCWKCIGEWCSENPHDDYRVSIVTCPQYSSCMKVYYKMYDNSSQLIESVTRSCSIGQCIPTSVNHYTQCLSNIRIYGIDGCSLKSCCANKDLCNSSLRFNPDWTRHSIQILIGFGLWTLFSD